jgi:hypothetical protein
VLPEPWYYRFLETYAKVILWFGSISAGLGVLGVLMVVGVTVLRNLRGEALFGAVILSIAVVFTLGVWLCGLLFWVALLLLAVGAGRNLRPQRPVPIGRPAGALPAIVNLARVGKTVRYDGCACPAHPGGPKKRAGSNALGFSSAPGCLRPLPKWMARSTLRCVDPAPGRSLISGMGVAMTFMGLHGNRVKVVRGAQVTPLQAEGGDDISSASCHEGERPTTGALDRGGLLWQAVSWAAREQHRRFPEGSRAVLTKSSGLPARNRPAAVRPSPFRLSRP